MSVEQRLTGYGRGESVLDLTRPRFEVVGIAHRVVKQGGFFSGSPLLARLRMGLSPARHPSPGGGSAQPSRYFSASSAAMQPLPALSLTPVNVVLYVPRCEHPWTWLRWALPRRPPGAMYPPFISSFPAKIR